MICKLRVYHETDTMNYNESKYGFIINNIMALNGVDKMCRKRSFFAKVTKMDTLKNA